MSHSPDSTPKPPPHEVLSGQVERVTFQSGESGFSVLKVKVKGFRDLVPVIGVMPNVTAGEWIEATGHWEVDRQHGRQFKVDGIKTTRPDTLDGIERYLGSGLIKGIGPHFAKKLVDTFGADVFDIIEQSPERLNEVGGIGTVRRQKITAGWHDQKAIREIMVFLHSHGVGTSRSFRIYKTYGDDAIAIVQENPYRLAYDIWGIGFKTADTIAESLGIKKDSDIRARAGVEYVLSQLTEEGHCAFPRDQLIAKAVEMLAIPMPVVEAAVDFELGDGRIVARQTEVGELIYLAGLDASEGMLARNLIELSRRPHPCPEVDIARAIEWVEGRTGMSLAPAQRDAIGMAVKSKVLVITGGPGVGKTTLVNSIVQVFAAKRLSVVLAAPTGRAAKRMTETSGIEARTIHRLLEFDPATGDFKRNREKPLEGDVFVIDEASMVDLVLGHQLVRAIPPHAALILVGDVDQLPSVGPGMVLSDIITSEALPVCRLTEVFRQAAESRIVTNAHRVNKGMLPVWPREKLDDPTACDFYFIEQPDPDEAERILSKLVLERLPDRFGFDPFRDIQVLAPMTRGVLGTRNLNQSLQQVLNPAGRQVLRYGVNYRVGDKIMQTQNDYDKEVFNGDIGRIKSMDDIEREAVLDFDGREVVYGFDEFDEVTHAYAVTIHKAQGSEYPCIVIPVDMQHYMMLHRNLIYTGITRGRKMVVLIGAVKALAMAVKRTDSKRRITTLRARLQSIT